jgi:L-aspartate oxidase
VPPTVTSDFLIIGSGIAGLSLALKAAEHGEVAVVTKRSLTDSATDNAQGGLAIVISDEDSFEEHIRDTMEAGAGLCDPGAVRRVVTEAPSRLEDLVRWGVTFAGAETLDPDAKKFELGLEGGHSKRRILHVGDYTGHAIESVLADRVRAHPRIKIYDHHFAVDLITRRRLTKGEGADACGGAYVLSVETGEVKTFLARATALCTGGAGKVYLYTSNPDIATGDGMALAWRAGASLANMEFVQFHPTCLYQPKAKNFLISEALRGEGAILKNRAGERFVKKFDPRGELASRDIVARAIDAELKHTGDECVFLDISHRGADYVRRRFPRIYERCQAFGIDITAQPIPVVPAAHYFCGGAVTDLHGQTSIPGLAAVGETACTGLHGANRLASNSLPEALVFAHAVAESWRGLKDAAPPFKAADVPAWNPGRAKNPDELVVISQLWDEIRRFMWNYVGIARTTKRLERALRRIENLRDEIQDYYWDFLVTPDLLELRNLAVVAESVVRGALSRKESRGLHYTLDFPEPHDDQKKPSVLKRSL